MFSWIEFPDKATRDACNKAVFEDPRMEALAVGGCDKMPRRMIFGGYEVLLRQVMTVGHRKVYNEQGRKQMAKAFASQGDMTEKKITFDEIGEGLWAFTAEGDPNSGVIIGDDSCDDRRGAGDPAPCEQGDRKGARGDRQADHASGADPLSCRSCVWAPRPTTPIRSSCRTSARAMVVERGQEDWDSEFQRFPASVRGPRKHSGADLSHDHVQRQHDRLSGQPPGGHQTDRAGAYAGDAVIHVPDQNVMFTGDIVEDHSACYCGDGYFGDWGQTLDNVRKAYDVDAIAPGRGGGFGRQGGGRASDCKSTRDFVDSTYQPAAKVAMKGGSAERRLGCGARGLRSQVQGLRDLRALPAVQCVSRAYDEARGIWHPRIWTDKRDLEMWEQLQG